MQTGARRRSQTKELKNLSALGYAARMTLNVRLLAAAVFLLPFAALALGPHEVLVLANDSSVDSVHIAKAYLALRGIPSQNLVRVRLPLTVSHAGAGLTPDDFRRLIYEPAVQAARERGIARHVQAWAYSTDFPARVTTPTNMSLTGMTFVRGKPPDMQQVGAGTYVSPLFGGPSHPRGAGFSPQTFDAFSEWLGPEMPLPAMMLGVTGSNANTRAQVLASLEKAALSDHSFPTGTVYFVTSRDIRSEAREWQFPDVVKELRALRVSTSVAPAFPSQARDILGLMAGAASVDPGRYGSYLPGAMAEHFTSAAGVFQNASQTKLTAWIAVGATASAGTVTEPYALWAKFPHARFFVYYASGCTVCESFYQAIRCPLQIVAVGDPLAQPFAPGGTVSIRGLKEPLSDGSWQIRAEVSGATAQFGRVQHFVDGRSAGSGPELTLPRSAYAQGRHTLRSVVSQAGTVRSQLFAEEEFEVP